MKLSSSFFRTSHNASSRGVNFVPEETGDFSMQEACLSVGEWGVSSENVFGTVVVLGAGITGAGKTAETKQKFT